MSDDDALRAAIVAAPDADLPRLVYADFIEERGDEAGAACIRAQVELAATPEYEPFAVLCANRFPEWVNGDARRRALPWFPDTAACNWDSENAVRRGFGWSLAVHFLPVLQVVMPQVRAREPVQSLAVGTHPIDQWEEIARTDWLPAVRALRFTGIRPPNEPMRVLRGCPNATGIDELHFTRGDSPAMSEILQDLFATPLGGQIRKMSLRFSTQQSDELIAAVAPGADALRDLTLSHVSLAWNAVRALIETGLLGKLEVFRLTECFVAPDCVRELSESPHLRGVTVLDLTNDTVSCTAVEHLAASPHVASLRKLNLNHNPLGNRAARHLARSPYLSGLRSLSLRQTGTDNAAVRRLTRGTFWMNLVELDLTRNPLDDRGARHLLTAPTPADLTALRLPINRFSEPVREELTRKYGDAVRLFDVDG